ncbi:MAG: SDR family NAD(P)-dependent oxidoreductase [Flavobacteriales bacterium]|jgi:3-hydroxy acid dehydrogenase/malonic semialdehyde reductase
MKPIALITGATSGFGKATAERFAREGWNIIITGRREERLSDLKQKLETAHPIEVRTLAFDVQSLEACKAALHSLSDSWKAIDVLVNNAGLALGREPFMEGSIEQWNTMIDTNIKGLLYISQLIAPWMIARKRGTIINVGSIAGKEPYGGGNVYGATKAAVDILTRNMRIDLLPHGIRVGQVAPGAVETEFSLVRFGGDIEKAAAAYKGFTPLIAEDIADAIWYMASRPAHVCINDMVITPTAQANATSFHRQ